MTPEEDRAILLARVLAVMDHGRSLLGIQGFFNWGAHFSKPVSAFTTFLQNFLFHNVPELRKLDGALADRIVNEVGFVIALWKPSHAQTLLTTEEKERFMAEYFRLLSKWSSHPLISTLN